MLWRTCMGWRVKVKTIDEQRRLDERRRLDAIRDREQWLAHESSTLAHRVKVLEAELLSLKEAVAAMQTGSRGRWWRR